MTAGALSTLTPAERAHVAALASEGLAVLDPLRVARVVRLLDHDGQLPVAPAPNDGANLAAPDGYPP